MKVKVEYRYGSNPTNTMMVRMTRTMDVVNTSTGSIKLLQGKRPGRKIEVIDVKPVSPPAPKNAPDFSTAHIRPPRLRRQSNCGISMRKPAKYSRTDGVIAELSLRESVRFFVSPH